MVMVDGLVVDVFIDSVVDRERFGYRDRDVFFNCDMIGLLYRDRDWLLHWYRIGFLHRYLDGSHNGNLDSLRYPDVNRLWYRYGHWYRLSHWHRNGVRHGHFDGFYSGDDVVVDDFVLGDGFEAVSAAAAALGLLVGVIPTPGGDATSHSVYQNVLHILSKH